MRSEVEQIEREEQSAYERKVEQMRREVAQQTQALDIEQELQVYKEQLEAEDKSHTAQTATLLRAASGPASARRHQLAHAGGPLCQRSRGRRQSRHADVGEARGGRGRQ